MYVVGGMIVRSYIRFYCTLLPVQGEPDPGFPWTGKKLAPVPGSPSADRAPSCDSTTCTPAAGETAASAIHTPLWGHSIHPHCWDTTVVVISQPLGTPHTLGQGGHSSTLLLPGSIVLYSCRFWVLASVGCYWDPVSMLGTVGAKSPAAEQILCPGPQLQGLWVLAVWGMVRALSCQMWRHLVLAVLGAPHGWEIRVAVISQPWGAAYTCKFT